MFQRPQRTNEHRPHGCAARNADILAAHRTPPPPAPGVGRTAARPQRGMCEGSTGQGTDRQTWVGCWLCLFSAHLSGPPCPVGEAGAVLPALVRLYFAQVLRAHGGGIWQRARTSQQPRNHDAEKRGPGGRGAGARSEGPRKTRWGRTGPLDSWRPVLPSDRCCYYYYYPPSHLPKLLWRSLNF